MTDQNDDGPNKATSASGEHEPDQGPRGRPSTEQMNASAADAGAKGAAVLEPAALSSEGFAGSNGLRADKKSNAAKKRHSRKNPENTECQNCGATLQGDYCHQCGQAAKEPRRLVIGLVQDVFVDTLAIDGKLARSIALLLWRPSLLARRFLEGKRVRYSPPFRLFLFASVFFFFAASLLIDVPTSLPVNGDATIDPVELAAAKEGLDEARKEVAAVLGDDATDAILNTVEGLGDAADESAMDAAPTEPVAANAEAEAGEDADDISNEADSNSSEEDGGDGVRSFIDSDWADANFTGPAWLEPHAQRLYEAGQRVLDDPRLFYSEMRANVPRFLLLAPVIYGLTLTLLYFYRRKFFIYDHFIVSLYMHAALYAYLLLALLMSRAPVVGGWLWIGPVGWGLLQPLLVLRQAYGSNWFSVWIKWFISASIYLIALVMIIMLGLSYSLYQS